MMMCKGWIAPVTALVLGLGAVAGCSRSGADAPVGAADASGPDAAYLFASEPAEAVSISSAREATDEVTVVGRIGGSPKPFVDGLAAFTIVDPAVPYCAPDEGCPTPWDYCCKRDEVKGNSAMVTMVDAEGNAVARDARELLGVEELAVVVVQGQAERDEEGNLTVLAEKLFVRDRG